LSLEFGKETFNEEGVSVSISFSHNDHHGRGISHWLRGGRIFLGRK
jgi:hypothetical protein